ncbi:hypothetical protein SDC9_212005 [bioreactor metagenome]|uniref:Uncharacterized protein n=1 Tax=bioreactor metagenome TaxID=1076179 RepID=A0A645JXB0_9ZZZZ
MLVHLDARYFAQITHVPRTGHNQGKIGHFLFTHAVYVNGHQQGRGLVIGYFPSYQAVDKILQFAFTKAAAVPFFCDDIKHPHVLIPPEILIQIAFDHAVV